MDADVLTKALKFVFISGGVPKSKLLARWDLFAYPFWNNAAKTQVGFVVMAYKGVDSTKTRVAKMCLNHGINILTGALGANLTGVGALGSGLGTASGKFGGLKSAFDVDIGAVQLSTILENSDSSPRDIGSAIIASGKLVYYAVVRVDKAEVGYKVQFRGDTTVNSYTEWGIKHIKTIQTSATTYSIWPNGIIHKGTTIIGNYKSGKKA